MFHVVLGTRRFLDIIAQEFAGNQKAITEGELNYYRRNMKYNRRSLNDDVSY
jgi:hypothetical protein